MSAPEEPSFNVSVFHFTSRISTAKIRKYKSATEKGMGPATSIGRTPTPGASNRQPTPSTNAGPQQSEEPPAKKPRLRLKVREPDSNGQSLSPDTIAVSRPKRNSSLHVRYSESMDVDDVKATGTQSVHKPRAASAASTASSLTSLSSVPSQRKETVPPATKGSKQSAKPSDYNQDFLSYYVTGDADGEDNGEDETPAAVPVKPASVKQPQVEPSTFQQLTSVIPQAPAQTARPQQPIQPPVQRETKFRNHTGPPPPYPTSAREKPPPRPAPQPPAQPCVHIIDNMAVQTGPRPVTVGEMVGKLNHLSNALASFGGTPPPRPFSPDLRPPVPGPAMTIASQDPANSLPTAAAASVQANGHSQQNKSAADGLLAMFDDYDDDDDNTDDAKTEASTSKADGPVTEPTPAASAATPAPPADSDNPLNRPLEQPGNADDALYYGIKFIQNALRSWARQRLNTEYAHFYWTEHQRYSSQVQAPRRGPGRPRKFDDDQARNNLPPANIRMDLAHTNEGKAIAAFQDVLDCGCLQVNANLPIELSRALRTLYAQIDQLINEVPKFNPQWQCLSYDVQITANKIRVDEWKEARSRAQAEMERQHKISQHQVLQGMAMQGRREGQGRQTYTADLDGRSGSQQMAQPTHQSPYPPLPMLSTNQAGASGSAAASFHMPDGPLTSSPHTGPPVANGTPQQASRLPTSTPIPSSPVSVQDVQLDKIKQLMPSNLLSRSGQSMKFSFAPNNELAIKAFGAQAFPADQSASNLPNRGPMAAGSSSPAITINSSPRLPNGANGAANPTSYQSPSTATEQPPETIQVAARPGSRQASQSSPTTTKEHASLINGSATASTSLPKAYPSTVPNGNPAADEELASRFPHLGAVVVNE